MDFVGKLGKYKIIEAEDQSKTLWSEFFNENFHNLAGAYAETVYNYISGCHIEDQIKGLETLHVLDVGFGMGLGLKALMDVLEKNSAAPKEATYTSIELDEELFLWSIKETFPELVFNKKAETYICETPLLSITVYIGDGRKTLVHAFEQSLLPKFTAIFQDAFSPKRNPMLWTVEWFANLKMMSSDLVYLSTYSGSGSVRKSMIAAGWKIENARGFGQKKTMTKARLIGVTNEAVAAELSRTPTLELRDN